MKVFVDTNVIADWLIPTNSSHEDATAFMRLCLFRQVDAFVSSHSLADLFYITRKQFDAEERKSFIRLIVSRLTVLTEGNGVFIRALEAGGGTDLEDNLQMVCAERGGVDFIVTENLKDFRNSAVPAISIRAALERLSAS